MDRVSLPYNLETTVARYSEMDKTRLEELSAENSSLREQLAQAEGRRLKAEVDRDRRLERTRNEHPLAVALLDGDGMIFDPKYLTKGEEGGREAAYKLMIALTNDDKCDRTEYNTFMKGLVQGYSLLNVVDVDAGKERADDKMRSHLRLFLSNFQTRIVFFGGCHDDGYAGSLQDTQTDGWGKKIVLLRGYSNEPIPEGIGKLQLPMVEIPGLFKPEKIPKFPVPQQPQASIPQLLSPPLPSSSLNSTPAHSPRKKDPNTLGFFSQPSPSPRWRKQLCWYWNLLGECKDEACPFDHITIATPEQKKEMRQKCLSTPCASINQGNQCDNGQSCVYGHKCPNGSECEANAKGRCKFKGGDMHA